LNEKIKNLTIFIINLVFSPARNLSSHIYLHTLHAGSTLQNPVLRLFSCYSMVRETDAHPHTVTDTIDHPIPGISYTCHAYISK